MKLPIRQLALMMAGVASCYALAVFLTGDGSRLASIRPLYSLPVLLAVPLCLASYLLRGWRWCLWMTHFGRKLPLLQGQRLYLAGYAFTPTPGNVGEALRSMMLSKQPLGLGQSLALFGAERLADLLCLLLLCVPAILWLVFASHLAPHVMTVGTFLLFAVALILVVSFALRDRIERSLLRRWPWLSQAWQCLRERPWRWFSLTLVAWTAQGIAVWLVCLEMELALTAGQATGFYALSMVGGAVSMLPAGLGGMEAIFTALLLTFGSDLGRATLVTVVVRLLTLWLAVALGALALLYSAAFAKDLRLA